MCDTNECAYRPGTDPHTSSTRSHRIAYGAIQGKQIKTYKYLDVRQWRVMMEINNVNEWISSFLNGIFWTQSWWIFLIFLRNRENNNFWKNHYSSSNMCLMKTFYLFAHWLPIRAYWELCGQLHIEAHIIIILLTAPKKRY